MDRHEKRVESHGCIVCGRLYDLLVVYGPDRRMIDCTVTSPGGRRVHDPQHPLVACDSHPAALVEAACARRTAASDPEQPGEDD